MQDEDERVYRKHAEELTRFATFLVGPDDAPDVVTDAVLRVFTSTAWTRVDQPRPYLFRAVLNEARMHQRAARRRHARELRAVARDDTPTLADHHDALTVLDGLSRRQRAVVYLAYWEDLDPAASAELLGISEGSVRRHLARGREALRRTLDAD